jgi:hypothetical protein
MSQKLQDYMCKYVQEKIESLKGCLLAVLNSKEQYVSLLDESLGTPTPSMDLKLCELLANAGLFREEIKLNRDGRNEYKLFYLTYLGKEMAQQLKNES